MTTNHKLLLAGLCLIILLGGNWLYIQNVKAGAYADAIIKAKQEENDRLKDENKTIQADADKRIADIEAQKKAVTTSPQAIRIIRDSVPLSHGPVAQAPTPQEVEARKAAGDKVPDAPSAVFDPKSTVELSQFVLTCKQNDVKLTSCEEQRKNDAQQIANLNDSLKASEKARHPGFWRSTWKFIKIAGPAVITGFALGKALK